MSPLLELLGLSTDATVVDTVAIELHKPTDIDNVAYSYTGILKSDGTFSASFPTAAPHNYYIVIKSRNCIDTWSADSIQVNDGTTYDFSSVQKQAYGSNMFNLGDGNFRDNQRRYKPGWFNRQIR